MALICPLAPTRLGVMYEANGVSRRVSQALPDWNVVMMPPINYGHGGANLLGDMLVHPGTYAIRQSTLRSLVADIGGQIAQNGFKWIFVMNGHGAPTHNIAINEACDFVSETFRRDDAAPDRPVSGRCGDSIERREDQRPVFFGRGALLLRHGCSCRRRRNIGHARRPARIWFVPITKRFPSRAGRSLEELREIATAPGWQGYLSSPARATAAHGRAVEAWWIDGFTDLILRAVRGENLFVHPRVCRRRCLRPSPRLSRRHSRTKPHSKRSSRTGWRNAGSVSNVSIATLDRIPACSAALAGCPMSGALRSDSQLADHCRVRAMRPRKSFCASAFILTPGPQSVGLSEKCIQVSDLGPTAGR